MGVECSAKCIAHRKLKMKTILLAVQWAAPLNLSGAMICGNWRREQG